MPRSLSSLRLVLSLSALGFACGGDDLTLPNQGEPAAVEIFDGDRQNGTVGEALSDSLVVLVTDPFGDPVPGALVQWTAEGGGSVDPGESTTDADGRAGTRRILGTAPTTYLTIAAVEGIEEVFFTSTALTARLVITSKTQAIAVSGVALDPQPTLQLQDADGTPIAREGVVVSVQIASGGGSLDGTTTATSNAAGEVAFTDLALRGSPGTRRLIFAAEAFAPATSPPIALGAGAPASIELVAGDDQTATVGELVPIPPSLRVRDAEGTPLPGIPVAFTVTKGAGTLLGESPVTDADGIAAVSEWRLGPAVGENELSAEVSGQSLSGSPVVFSATSTAGGVSASQSQVEASPAAIIASSGSSAATIIVRVRDQFGNPVAGVPVALTADGSGNTLTQPSAPTDANGVATGRLSATAAGARNVTATANGVALEQVATVTVQPGNPSAATSTATVPANAQSGQATTIEILLRDAHGNAVAGRASAVVVAVSGANTVPGVTVSDQGGGRYQALYTPIVAGADQVDVRVSGSPVSGSPFSSTVAPGPVSPSASTAVVTWNFFTVNAVVTARDAQGNAVGRGGDVVVVTPEGFGPTTANDNGNGTYTATIATFSAPPVTITLNGAPIQGSPFLP
jgi:Bacterial Ig-like domain (group 1)/Filamin/ABP280 repeat